MWSPPQLARLVARRARPRWRAESGEALEHQPRLRSSRAGSAAAPPAAAAVLLVHRLAADAEHVGDLLPRPALLAARCGPAAPRASRAARAARPPRAAPPRGRGWRWRRPIGMPRSWLSTYIDKDDVSTWVDTRRPERDYPARRGLGPRRDRAARLPDRPPRLRPGGGRRAPAPRRRRARRACGRAAPRPAGLAGGPSEQVRAILEAAEARRRPAARGRRPAEARGHVERVEERRERDDRPPGPAAGRARPPAGGRCRRAPACSARACSTCARGSRTMGGTVELRRAPSPSQEPAPRRPSDARAAARTSAPRPARPTRPAPASSRSNIALSGTPARGGRALPRRALRARRPRGACSTTSTRRIGR